MHPRLGGSECPRNSTGPFRREAPRRSTPWWPGCAKTGRSPISPPACPSSCMRWGSASRLSSCWRWAWRGKTSSAPLGVSIAVPSTASNASLPARECWGWWRRSAGRTAPIASPPRSGSESSRGGARASRSARRRVPWASAKERFATPGGAESCPPPRSSPPARWRGRRRGVSVTPRTPGGVAVKRHEDRALARRGLLNEVPPRFVAAEGVRYGGAWLALPALLALGILEAGEQTYGVLKQAFYGLRATLLTLAFMALLRIRTPEQLQGHPPGEWGMLWGLDRAPEVKTLRRQLWELAAR